MLYVYFMNTRIVCIIYCTVYLLSLTYMYKVSRFSTVTLPGILELGLHLQVATTLIVADRMPGATEAMVFIDSYKHMECLGGMRLLSFLTNGYFCLPVQHPVPQLVIVIIERKDVLIDPTRVFQLSTRGSCMYLEALMVCTIFTLMIYTSSTQVSNVALGEWLVFMDQCTLPWQWSLITISQENHSFPPMFPADHCRLMSVFHLKVRWCSKHV